MILPQNGGIGKPPQMERVNVMALLFPIGTCRAPEKLATKDFALFERSEFAKSRQLRGAQGSPQDQVTRVPFLLVRFLWASKENEQYVHILAGEVIPIRGLLRKEGFRMDTNYSAALHLRMIRPPPPRTAAMKLRPSPA